MIDPAQPAAMNELRRVIASCMSEGRVIYSRHARERMSERDCDLVLVERVLQSGSLRLSDYRNDFGSWTYTAERDSVRVVFAVDLDDEGNSILVITIVRFK